MLWGFLFFYFLSNCKILNNINLFLSRMNKLFVGQYLEFLALFYSIFGLHIMRRISLNLRVPWARPQWLAASPSCCLQHLEIQPPFLFNYTPIFILQKKRKLDAKCWPPYICCSHVEGYQPQRLIRYLSFFQGLVIITVNVCSQGSRNWINLCFKCSILF